MLDASDKGKVYKTNEQKQKNSITFSVDVYKVTRDINRLQNITTKPITHMQLFAAFGYGIVTQISWVLQAC